MCPQLPWPALVQYPIFFYTRIIPWDCIKTIQKYPDKSVSMNRTDTRERMRKKYMTQIFRIWHESIKKMHFADCTHWSSDEWKIWTKKTFSISNKIKWKKKNEIHIGWYVIYVSSGRQTEFTIKKECFYKTTLDDVSLS